jgi:tRNA 2-thiouridine synthesizing protein B
MLHIINKSPFDANSLDSCLRMAQPGHALLLIEDGIYAAAKGSAVERHVAEACTKFSVFALQPDMDARGMTSKLMDGVTLTDYAGFVDLVEKHNTSHSWL